MSEASGTLSGVTQLKIGDICLYVWTYVCHFVLCYYYYYHSFLSAVLLSFYNILEIQSITQSLWQKRAHWQAAIVAGTHSTPSPGSRLRAAAHTTIADEGMPRFSERVKQTGCHGTQYTNTLVKTSSIV